MRKLVRGIVEFRKNLTAESRSLFAKLAIGQKPDALFIACSDSRVVPNLFASTNPGDLFVLRNVGNLVPPAGSPGQEDSVAAALEFSVLSLAVSDIIVCGHSECGAMQALSRGNCPKKLSWDLEPANAPSPDARSRELSPITPAIDFSTCLGEVPAHPHLTSWLRHGEASLAKLREEGLDSSLSACNRLSQLNVLQQLEHIKSYPFVRERLDRHLLSLHGWWFDIAQADVYSYEPRLDRFILVEESFPA